MVPTHAEQPNKMSNLARTPERLFYKVKHSEIGYAYTCTHCVVSPTSTDETCLDGGNLAQKNWKIPTKEWARATGE